MHLAVRRASGLTSAPASSLHPPATRMYVLLLLQRSAAAEGVAADEHCASCPQTAIMSVIARAAAATAWGRGSRTGVRGSSRALLGWQCLVIVQATLCRGTWVGLRLLLVSHPRAKGLEGVQRGWRELRRVQGQREMLTVEGKARLSLNGALPCIPFVLPLTCCVARRCPSRLNGPVGQRDGGAASRAPPSSSPVKRTCGAARTRTTLIIHGR